MLTTRLLNLWNSRLGSLPIFWYICSSRWFAVGFQGIGAKTNSKQTYRTPRWILTAKSTPALNIAAGYTRPLYFEKCRKWLDITQFFKNKTIYFCGKYGIGHASHSEEQFCSVLLAIRMTLVALVIMATVKCIPWNSKKDLYK